MSNLYHRLHKKPVPNALQKAQAKRLVAGGRMRIDADEKCNFVRFPTAQKVYFFSQSEVFDSNLNQRTKTITGSSFETLKKEFSTLLPISKQTQFAIAALFVQSAEPQIIDRLIAEGVEVFISYSHSIGDLLDFENWQEQRYNNGMQSLGFQELRVFVSCDGNPLEDANARARLMVIAAQEVAHYADLMRKNNQIIGRYSLTNKCQDARRKDIIWIEKVAEIFKHLNLQKSTKLEKDISYIKKYRKFSIHHPIAIAKSWVATKALQMRAQKFNVKIAHLYNSQELTQMLADMRFNLTPQAPAYERDTPQQQEQIYCIEALARVPQQVIKWGHDTTKFMYPNLYRFYYERVV